MNECNKARDTAVLTGDPIDWVRYRVLRNESTNLQRKDKADFTKETFKHIEETKDSSELHRLTKDLLGLD